MRFLDYSLLAITLVGMVSTTSDKDSLSTKTRHIQARQTNFDNFEHLLLETQILDNSHNIPEICVKLLLRDWMHSKLPKTGRGDDEYYELNKRGCSFMEAILTPKYGGTLKVSYRELVDTNICLILESNERLTNFGAIDTARCYDTRSRFTNASLSRKSQ